MHYALTRFCNLDFSHPFAPYCDEEDIERCKLQCVRDKPVCRVTESRLSLHACQPQAQYVCTYAKDQLTCGMFSYCSWNSTGDHCYDPLTLPLVETPAAVEGDSEDGIVVVFGIMGGILLFAIIVFFFANIRMRVRPDELKDHRRPVPVQRKRR